MVGVVGAVALGYQMYKSDRDITASCVDDNNVVVPDEYCGAGTPGVGGIFIFAGAPLFEHMRSYPRLSAAFQAITSVIVGVIAWVGVWFALHLFFASVTMFETGLLRIPLVPWGAFQLGAAGLSALAALMFFILRLPLGAVLVLTILAGFGVQALGFS